MEIVFLVILTVIVIYYFYPVNLANKNQINIKLKDSDPLNFHLFDEGDKVNIWFTPDKSRCLAYQKGSHDSEGCLGDVPGKYRKALIKLESKGGSYSAVISKIKNNSITLLLTINH